MFNFLVRLTIRQATKENKMLYYVKINNTVIFKGNYYACLDYVSSIQVGASKCKINNRK